MRETELTPEQIVQSAQENHIWCNAFSCVKPTDAFCLEVGKQVVRMLNSSEIAGDCVGIEIGKVAYIRINKS